MIILEQNFKWHFLHLNSSYIHSYSYIRIHAPIYGIALALSQCGGVLH